LTPGTEDSPVALIASPDEIPVRAENNRIRGNPNGFHTIILFP